MKTTQEATRGPRGSGHATPDEPKGFVMDTEKFEYIRAPIKDDAVKGYNPNLARNQRKRGFVEVSTDPDITGHEEVVLMARPIERAQQEKEARNRKRKKPRTVGKLKEISAEELGRGVLVAQDKGMTLEQMGASLPSQASLDRENEENEALHDDPAVQRMRRRAEKMMEREEDEDGSDIDLDELDDLA